jgi:hypothetical protein
MRFTEQIFWGRLARVKTERRVQVKNKMLKKVAGVVFLLLCTQAEGSICKTLCPVPEEVPPAPSVSLENCGDMCCNACCNGVMCICRPVDIVSTALVQLVAWSTCNFCLFCCDFCPSKTQRCCKAVIGLEPENEE